MSDMSLRRKMLKRQVTQLQNLPTISANVMSVLQQLRAPEINMNKLLGSINRDLVLVAQILKLINSGFYGLSREITKVEHAVNLLGVQRIKEILYSLSVMDALSASDERLWLHSFSSFYLMDQVLQQEKGLAASPDLPLTMLMHDIGEVVLEMLNPTSRRMAKSHSESKFVPIALSEMKVLEVEHGEVGGWLMEFWQMEPQIRIPISAHHCVEPPEAFAKETALVQIVDWIDLQARGMPAIFPSGEVLAAGGLADFPVDMWLGRHSSIVKSLDDANPIRALRGGGAAGAKPGPRR